MFLSNWCSWFTENTPTVPQFYWDVKSQEQRIKDICLRLQGLINYADAQTAQINANTEAIAIKIDYAGIQWQIDELNEKVAELASLPNEFAELKTDLQKEITDSVSALENKINAEIENFQEQTEGLITQFKTEISEELAQSEKELEQLKISLQALVNAESSRAQAEETALQQQISNLKIYNVLDYAKDETDVFKVANEIIAEYATSRICVYIPEGIYTVATNLNVNKTCDVVCAGEITVNATEGVTISTVDANVYIQKLVGNRQNTALKITNNEVTQGNCNIVLNYATNFATIVSCVASGGMGVQCNKIKGTLWRNFETGISFATEGQKSWINENIFENVWLFGGTNSTGIKTTKGSGQTDPYNGNKFNFISFENCTQCVNMQFAHRNNFLNFRLFENTGSNLIQIANDCDDNNFTSADCVIDFQEINDTGKRNFYNCIISNEGHGNYIATQAASCETGINITRNMYLNEKLTMTQGDYIRQNTYVTKLVLDGTTYNVPAVLNSGMTFPWLAHDMIISVGTLAGTASLMDYYGNLIATSASTNSKTGVKLEANTNYLLKCVAQSTWDLTKL